MVMVGMAVTVMLNVAVFVLSLMEVAVTTAEPVAPLALYVAEVVEVLVSAPGPLVKAHETPS